MLIYIFFIIKKKNCKKLYFRMFARVFPKRLRLSLGFSKVRLHFLRYVQEMVFTQASKCSPYLMATQWFIRKASGRLVNVWACNKGSNQGKWFLQVGENFASDAHPHLTSALFLLQKDRRQGRSAQGKVGAGGYIWAEPWRMCRCLVGRERRQDESPNRQMHM